MCIRDRSYPNLASQDTANIPKTIEDNGRTLTLQNISWQTDNTANTDGYACLLYTSRCV